MEEVEEEGVDLHIKTQEQVICCSFNLNQICKDELTASSHSYSRQQSSVIPLHFNFCLFVSA